LRCKNKRKWEERKNNGKREGEKVIVETNKHRRVSDSLNTCIEASEAFTRQKRDHEFREVDLKVINHFCYFLITVII